MSEDWCVDYNWNRPHTAHGDLAPAEFAAQWINQPKPNSTWTTHGVPLSWIRMP
jgi:putative transposase